jgi:hypothetical protein
MQKAPHKISPNKWDTKTGQNLEKLQSDVIEMQDIFSTIATTFLPKFATP